MDKSVTLKACPVEQVDRDAAAQWLRSVHSIYLALWIEGTGESPEWAESPNRDDYSLVQAFARHRSEAQATGLREALADPSAVHVNMLRGGIARPSLAQIIHIYGEDALRAALEGAERHG